MVFNGHVCHLLYGCAELLHVPCDHHGVISGVETTHAPVRRRPEDPEEAGGLIRSDAIRRQGAPGEAWCEGMEVMH